jgi:multidrug resistance efflux pump
MREGDRIGCHALQVESAVGRAEQAQGLGGLLGGPKPAALEWLPKDVRRNGLTIEAPPNARGRIDASERVVLEIMDRGSVRTSRPAMPAVPFSSSRSMSATFSRTIRCLDADARPPRALSALVGALATAWVAWFVAAPVNVYEVADGARLEVEAAAHPVAAQIDGRVVATDLAIGREVRAGVVLVALDSESQQLEIRERAARLKGLAAKLQALRGEIAAEREAAEKHHRAREAALAQLAAKAEESAARARFAELSLANLTKLRSREAVAREEYERGLAEAQALRAADRANNFALESGSLEREVAEGDRRVRLAALEVEATGLGGDIATEEAALRRLEQSVEMRRVRAPISGRVGELVPEFRVGSVVRAGERLGTIVPPGRPGAVAMFPAEQVGRIRPGQPARLRLHGFPWTQYGTLPARVDRVGNEASRGLIRVELGLESDPDSRIPVAHGLPGTAEVAIERVTPAVLVLRAVGLYLAARRGTSAGPEAAP